MSDAMILPPVGPGSVIAADWNDDRIPPQVYVPGDPFGDHPVVPVGQWATRPGCEDGRHLFDMLESATDRYTEREDGSERTETTFHARLTCVRCGLIRDWTGTRSESEQPRALDPAPVVAGTLRAQQTRGADSWGIGGTWSIYDETGAPVGGMGRDRTPRARVRFVARLVAWPASHYVEGPTPIAALRRLDARSRAAARSMESAQG